MALQTGETEIMEGNEEKFMREALKEARYAFEEDEVPIGAVVVNKNIVIGRGYNQTEKLRDSTAHAEMIAITSASAYLGSKYLIDCELYVTIEPCLMCAGAIQWSRLGKLYYGAAEPKFGFTRYGAKIFKPEMKIYQGILSGQCTELMQQFFKEKRNT